MNILDYLRNRTENVPVVDPDDATEQDILDAFERLGVPIENEENNS